MERLTKHSKQTSHENGICCTHFYGPECLGVGGNCAMNCKWEEAAWSRLAAYEDTGLTPAEVHSMSGEWCAMMSVLNSIGGGYDRLRELAEADKDGRVVVAMSNKQAAAALRERGKRAVEDASPYAAATERRAVGGGVPDAPDGTEKMLGEEETMSDRELLDSLRRLKVQTGSLACLGCAHEDNCGIHGCAILREMIAWLERTLAEGRPHSVMEYKDRDSERRET